MTPERGRLPERLRQDAGEHERREVEAARRAEAGLERRPEERDEDEREGEVGDDPRAVAQQLDEVAVGDGEDRRELSRHRLRALGFAVTISR